MGSEETQGQENTERTVTRDDQPSKNDIICPFTLKVTQKRGKPVAQNYRCTWRATLEIEEDDGSVTVGGWECRPVTSGKYEDAWASDFVTALENLKQQLPEGHPIYDWNGVWKFTHADGQQAMQEFIQLVRDGRVKVINRHNKRNNTYSWDRFVANGAPTYDELKEMHPDLYKDTGTAATSKPKERIKHVHLDTMDFELGDKEGPPASEIILGDENETTEHIELEVQPDEEVMSSEEEPAMAEAMGSGRQPMTEGGEGIGQMTEERERSTGEGGPVGQEPGDPEPEQDTPGSQQP